jgi:glutamate dehydrogenase
MAVRLAAETGRSTADVAHAFMAAREVFDLPGQWQRIDALDGKVDGETQLALYAATQELVNAGTLWFLRDGAAGRDLAGTIARNKAGVAALSGALEGVLPQTRKAALAQAAAGFGRRGVPSDLAADVARLGAVAQAPAVTEIARTTGQAVPEAARVYFDIGARMLIDELSRRGGSVATADPYERQAINRALEQLAAAQVSFTRAAIRAGGSAAWLAGQGERFERALRTTHEAAGEGALTLSRLVVAAGALNDLAAASD